MKKKALGILLPVVAATAFAGTGFGLWVFNNTAQAQTINAAMQLEPAVSVASNALSDVKITNIVNSEDPTVKNYLLFDQDYQTDGSWDVTIQYKFTFDVYYGVKVNHSETPANTFFVPNIGDTDFTNEFLSKNKIEMKVKENTLSEYVATGREGNAEYSKKLSDLVAAAQTTDDTNNKITYEITDSYTFHFAVQPKYNKVNTISDWELFRTAVSDATLTFEVSYLVV